jgi:hypothetical protein
VRRGGAFSPAEAIFDAEREAGACPGRSVLCVYVRTRARPGDKAMRKRRPAGNNVIIDGCGLPVL